ncbi:MAG: very short patch repair endonuclease [Steroidobacteraceae bacterium]
MADVFSKQKRSEVMSRIRARDTKPERAVRSMLHRKGYRFRLHARGLPGKPDIVLPGLGTIVFVHGCFWHRHVGCPFAYTPKSRGKFWSKKFESNITRDAQACGKLRELGWRVLTIWECELRSPARLSRRLDVTLRKARASRASTLRGRSAQM